MFRSVARIAAPCLLLLASLAGHAQIYKLHNADVSGSGIGQFTRTLTSDTGTQRTTDSFGGLFSLRDHPVAWAGVEFNYSYNRFTEQFSPGNGGTGRLLTNVHEATGAYLFHPHFRNLQPFVGIGGGALAFIPLSGNTQWRGTGLLEFGLDIPTSNPHFGFRAQGRSLYYRAPNYNVSGLSTESWVVTTEPSLGVYLRF